MVYGPPGFSVFRPWSNVGPRQMWMPRPTRPMVSYNYTNQCCGSYGSGMGNGAWWALGIGAGIGLLPSILNWCGVGGGRKAAAAEETAAQIAADRSSTLANLEKLYKDKGYTVIDEGGKFYVTKDGETIAEGKTFADIQTAMNEIIKPEAPKADASGFTQQEALTAIKEFGVEDKITITDDGKIQYTDANGNTVTQEFNQINLYKAITTVKGTSQQPPAADDPVAAFNNNNAVKAKGATLTKNNDGTFTLTYTEGNKTITVKNLSDITSAYRELGLKADGTAIQGGGGNGGRFTYPKLPQGYDWKYGREIGKDFAKLYPAGTEVSKILADIKKDYPDLDITEEMIIAANPGGIDASTKKVKDPKKLEIPTKTSQVKINEFDKNTKITTRMVFDLTAQVATITTPDGTTFKYERTNKVAMTGDNPNEEAQAAFYKEAEAALAQLAKDAGWTNLTIAMKDPKSGKFVNPGSGEEITPDASFDKTKACTVRYLTAGAGDGKTIATAYMPDGSFISVTAPGNEAEAVLALKAELKNKKWSNVRLVGKKVDHNVAAGEDPVRSEIITETSVKKPGEVGTTLAEGNNGQRCYEYNGKIYSQANVVFGGTSNSVAWANTFASAEGGGTLGDGSVNSSITATVTLIDKDGNTTTYSKSKWNSYASDKSERESLVEQIITEIEREPKFDGYIIQLSNRNGLCDKKEFSC